MSGNFFQQINYSACNEDSAAELTALRLTGRDKVLCITGSGARPLDVLTADTAKIISLDFNPAQNHLLQLKIAAWRRLEYVDLLEFLGVTNSNRRSTLFESIVGDLPSASRQYWAGNRRKIENGVLYCGTWERLLKWMSTTTLFRRKHVRNLFEAPDLAAQTDEWNRYWANSRLLKTFLHCASIRFLWTHIIREPGAALIPRDFDVAKYILNCLNQMARHSLLRENPFANLLFFGRYQPQCRLPLHLRAEQFDLICDRLDRIEIVTGGLDDYLSQHPESFDAFSLSDFSSYAPADVYRSTWSEIIKSARDGARFCERFFLVKPDGLDVEIAKPPFDAVKLNATLAKDLAQIDHTCLYSFQAGVIGSEPTSKT